MFVGVQLQATPACTSSSDTFAETVVVPPGTTLDDSGDRTTEMDRGCVAGGVPDCEVPPQPARNRLKVRNASKKRESLPVLFFKFIRLPIQVAGRLVIEEHHANRVAAVPRLNRRLCAESVTRVPALNDVRCRLFSLASFSPAGRLIDRRVSRDVQSVG